MKVREAFQILTQGVEMVHYDVRAGRGPTRNKKIVWMDPDILRICVDVSRPSQLDRSKGKVPPGLYLRDIGEVREGANAYDFIHNSEPPDLDDQCLSLIGTERTICLQLPSKFSRDWFFERFQLVIDDVLTEMEKTLRAKLKWTLQGRASEGPRNPTNMVQLKELLSRGLQVLHHHPNGRIIQSYIIFNDAANRISIQPMESSIFDFSRKPMGLEIKDIAEIRPGTHSIGFVRTNSTDKQGECLSLIGTECTIDIQLATTKARDLLAHKLKLFIDHWKSQDESLA